MYDKHVFDDSSMDTIISMTKAIENISPLDIQHIQYDDYVNAKEIFCYINSIINKALNNQHEPLTFLGYCSPHGNFLLSIGFANCETPYRYSTGTLIALKKLYEDVFTGLCDADIFHVPAQEPEHGVKTCLSVTFGNK